MTKSVIALDDKQRLEEFLRLLPEQEFNAYLNELEDAVMCPHSSLAVVPAINTSKEILSQFSSEVLNKKYLLFIEALDHMRIFVGDNFSMGDSTQCYELLSGRRNLKVKAQLEVWDEKYIELCALIANTKGKYDDLLKTAITVLSSEQGNKSKIIFQDSDGDYYLNEGNTPRLLKLKKESLYYEALDTVCSIAPDGGAITFRDFMGVVSGRLKKRLSGKDDKGKCKIIRSFLTDKSNGFLRASEVGYATFKGKPLIECDTSTGITFNNKK